ncbi:NAD-dependent epimerase/dehydratase family protein [Paenibacillus cymbidii]|uniref:NAD-dependent epimerase/dehydratase family protein n=1 Tax=Paenibacillus cymbidii TaxID=1639034 RepID=UPI0010810ED2|nr:NAD-dependent epimerase/dehydratase family protein [Paenibacillus cymbidii]
MPTGAKAIPCVLITGTTGMVGEGVLHECLLHPEIGQVIVVNRKPCGVTHPKLTEIIHADFFDITPLHERLTGVNACFFCLGVTSVGLNEAQYTRLTYELTLHVAGKLAEWNPSLVLCYVSGTGTDSTENGRSMWARVKGRTENALLRLPLHKAHMFRPGYIHPTKGLRNTHRYYRALTWLYPPLNKLFPRYFVTLREVGLAMIQTAIGNVDATILESPDIRRTAQLAVR